MSEKKPMCVNTVCRRFLLTTIALASCPMIAADVQGAELSGIATLTSQYIYRGRPMSDRDPAVQAGLDYATDIGVFVGFWGTSIDLQTRFGERDIELDYYIGYHHASQSPISLTATLLRYTYPGQTGPHSYNHIEALVSATLFERHSLEFGYTDDINGLGQIGRHWELRSEWPVANAWVISAGLGRNDLTDTGVSRYWHWDLGGSARFSWLTVDLRWYDNEEPDASVRPFSAGSQFVISFSAAF